MNIKDAGQPMIEVIDKSRKNQVQKILNLVPELCVLTGLTNEMRNVSFYIIIMLLELPNDEVNRHCYQAEGCGSSSIGG